MDFHFVQNRKENCHHDHILFNVKGNGNIVFSVYRYGTFTTGAPLRYNCQDLPLPVYRNGTQLRYPVTGLRKEASHPCSEDVFTHAILGAPKLTLRVFFLENNSVFFLENNAVFFRENNAVFFLENNAVFFLENNAVFFS